MINVPTVISPCRFTGTGGCDVTIAGTPGRGSRKCPECGSGHIGEFRAGTQQIEDLVKEMFPKARVLRMDMDTTRQKDGHEKILSTFADGDADILVGTQMIVKGPRFPERDIGGRAGGGYVAVHGRLPFR